MRLICCAIAEAGSGYSGAVRQGAPIGPVKTEKRCKFMCWRPVPSGSEQSD